MEWDQPVYRKAFSVSLDDQIRTQRLLHEQAGSKGRWWKGLLFYWGVLFVLTFAINEGHDHRLLLSLLQSAGATILVVVLHRLAHWNRICAWRKHFRKHFGPGPHDWEVELGDSQLIARSGDIEHRFAWRAICKVQRDDEGLRIFISTFGLVTIPAIVFANKDEAESWMQMIEQKTGLSFS